MWKECFDASVNSEFLERLVCWEADRKFLYPRLRLHTSMEVLRRQWRLSRVVYKTRFQSVVSQLEIETPKREKEMERIYVFDKRENNSPFHIFQQKIFIYMKMQRVN